MVDHDVINTSKYAGLFVTAEHTGAHRCNFVGVGDSTIGAAIMQYVLVESDLDTMSAKLAHMQ